MTDLMATWTKDPDENEPFEIRWSKRLNGDTIVSSVFIDVTDGITVGATSNTTTTTTVWLSGGTSGVTYSLTNRVTTAGGRTLDHDVTCAID